MAVPKCKVSSARRDKRRGSNWKLSAPSVAVCPAANPLCPTELARLAAPTMAVRSLRPRLSNQGKNVRGRQICLPLFPFSQPFSPGSHPDWDCKRYMKSPTFRLI